jgi:hypothetical protein
MSNVVVSASTCAGAWNCTVNASSPGTWTIGNIGSTTLAPGDYNSYLLYASPSSAGASGYVDFTGSITFSPTEKIVGIIYQNPTLRLSDTVFGVPGTDYPPKGFTTAGLEASDSIIWAAGSDAVYVNFHVVPGGVDMIRILTTEVSTVTPEPGALILLGSGLAGLAVFAKKRGKRAKA